MQSFTSLFTLSLAGSSLLLFATVSHDWKAPEKARGQKNPQEATPESLARGEKLYVENCQFCHGENGGGDGPVAAMLKEKPNAFNDSGVMAEITDGELFWKITTGKDPMPGFAKKFSEEDRWHVVNYTRSFSKK